jgi:hypothetical protein
MNRIEWTNKDAVMAAVDRWPQIFEEEITSTLRLAAELLRSTTVELTPVGGGSGPHGHLSNSIQVGEPQPHPHGWKIEYGSPAEYGEVIEYGRKPGSRMPPIDAIAVWVWERRNLFSGINSPEDAKKIAFPIARNIGKKGFSSAPDGKGKGWGMFEKSKEQNTDKIQRLMDACRDRISRRCEAATHG